MSRPGRKSLRVGPVWSPDPADVARSRIFDFALWLSEQRGYRDDPEDYAALATWSSTDPARFWSAVVSYFGVHFHAPPQQVLTGLGMPGTTWFPGATLNIAEHLLGGDDPDRVVLICRSEDAGRNSLSLAELRAAVGAFATRLREVGVVAGDRVVGYLPNSSAGVVSFLAAASIGACWAQCAPDYSAEAAEQRLGQLSPTVLIGATGYRFNGRVHDRRSELDQLRASLPTIKHLFFVDDLELSYPSDPATSNWSDALAEPAPLVIDPVPFDHPLWVLFTSGTTGRPKGIVHGHGGILLEQLVLGGLHLDLGPSDTFLWYTSPSWVMWNILVAGLLHGSRVILFDGSPTYPDASALWQAAAAEHVTVFGTSPGYLTASAKAGLEPGRDLDLGALRILGSTGSILAPDAHEWVRDHVGSNVQLNSISGGTDIAGAFVAGAPTNPVWQHEISGAALGVALAAWDRDGSPVIGTVGEMVITQPMPSMPLRFWDDPSDVRYREAYFSTYPGTWRQGDWITITDRGTIQMHGRSDATLNRNGVRMGSADVYLALESVPEIVDALVVGVEKAHGGYWMPLFVVLRADCAMDDQLDRRIRATIRAQASPRHVPDEIVVAPSLPRTRTGKRLEVPVKRMLQGAEPTQVLSVDSLDDPQSANWLIEFAQRRPEDSWPPSR